MLGREWEGVASTDYLTFEAAIPPPNPEVAVGPDHILTVVNRHILAYWNPNAGSATGAVPVNQAWISRSPLTQWIGEDPLNDVCPTVPRTNVTCVIDNASVRYDQMQGRYVVLFTAVDTGVRRASWVLIISNWATFNVGNPGTTEIFTTPQPPGPNQGSPNSGGVNTNWMIYYGSGRKHQQHFRHHSGRLGSRLRASGGPDGSDDRLHAYRDRGRGGWPCMLLPVQRPAGLHQ